MVNNNNSNKKTDSKQNNDSNDNFDWKRAGRTSFIWLIIIFGAVYISGLLTQSNKKEIEIEYTEYRKYLEKGEIQKGVIMGDVFHGEFKLQCWFDASLTFIFHHEVFRYLKFFRQLSLINGACDSLTWALMCVVLIVLKISTILILIILIKKHPIH